MNVKYKLSEVGVPHEVSVLVPTVCSACGESYSLNDGLTMLYCGNPFCVSKLVQRALSMCEVLDIKDFGESFFRSFFAGVDTEFISDLIAIDDDKAGDFVEQYADSGLGSDSGYLSLDAFSKRMDKWVNEMNLRLKRLTLPLYIRALALPNVKSRADIIFDKFQSMNEFYEELDVAFTIEEFASLLGVSTNSYDTMVSLIGSFGEFKDDILGFERAGFSYYVPVKGDVELKVVCSKAVGGGFRSKKDFYRHVDEHYAHKANIKWSSSATKSCDVLIWAGVDGSDEITSKVEKICTFNRQGSHIPILSASQFLEILNNANDGFSVKDTLDSLEIIDYVEGGY